MDDSSISFSRVIMPELQANANTRISVSVIFSSIPATFHLLSSGMVGINNIVIIADHGGIYWDWRERNQITTSNPKLHLEAALERGTSTSQQWAKIITYKVIPARLVTLTVQQKVVLMMHQNKTKKNPKLLCAWLINFFPVLTFCKHCIPQR